MAAAVMGLFMLNEEAIVIPATDEMVNLRVQVEGGIGEWVVNVRYMSRSKFDGRQIMLVGRIVDAQKKPAEKIF